MDTHPELNELKGKLMFVEVHFGKEIADRAREYSRKRGALK
jgi:hypothetical protein